MRGVLLFVCVAVSGLAQSYGIETIAGNGNAGFAGDRGPSYAAQLNTPVAVALDAAGRLYVADSANHRVRRVDPDGAIRTVAGNGQPGNSGDGGPAVEAAMSVSDVAVDTDGTLYIAGGEFVRAVDSRGAVRTVAGPEHGLANVTAIALEGPASLVIADGTSIRRISPDRTVSDVETGVTAPVLDVAVAPGGRLVFVADRVYVMPRGGSASPVSEEAPVGPSTRVAVDGLGELFISGSRIWKLSGGKLFTIAGLDQQGFSGDGGPAVLATLNAPSGMVVDSSGNVFVADTLNQRIRLLRAPFSGSIAAVSPRHRAVEIWPREVVLKWTGLANAASYDVYFGTSPDGLAKAGAASGTSWPAGTLQNRTTYYWRVETRALPNPPVLSPTFSFTTTAVTSEAPPQPQLLAPANFTMGMPASFTLTWTGGGATHYDVYLDETEAVSRRIGSTSEPRFVVEGLVPNMQYYWRVVALNSAGESQSRRSQFTTGPVNGFPWLIETVAGAAVPTADGLAALQSVLTTPRAVAPHLTSSAIYYVDGGFRIRRIDEAGLVSTVWTPNTGEIKALAVDLQGNLFAAFPEYVVRITRTGARSVFAGQPGRREFAGETGAAVNAAFNGISDIALDARGTVYIADTLNHRVRAVTAAGQIRTVAGTGRCDTVPEFTGPATALPICLPGTLDTDAQGNVYFASGNRILRLRADGTIEVSADGVVAASIAVDRVGMVLYSDAATMMIRRVNADGSTENWAGQADTDGRAYGFAGDGGPATGARFAFPDNIAFDATGKLIIADTYNHRIRSIDTNNVITTVAGISTSGSLFGPTDVAVDGGGTLYIADSGNNLVRRVTVSRFMDTLAGGGTSTISEVKSAADRKGRIARDLRFDMTSGSVVRVDTRGNVMFTDNRFAWTEPNTTEAVYFISTAGTVQDVIDAPTRKAGGIAQGLAGETYISDTIGHRILRVDPSGTVSVVAGNGTPGFGGDGGPVATALVHTPRSLSVSPDGELHVAEFGRVRKITNDGRIVTVANEHAKGITHDRLGNLYLTAGRSVYVVMENGRLVRVAGRENAPTLGDGGPALNARTLNPTGIAASPGGEIVFADTGENLVRRLIRNVPTVLSIVEPSDQLPLMVRLTGSTGRPVPEIPVSFAIVSNTLTPIVLGAPLTNVDGIARLTGVGSRSGPMTIRATVAGLPPVEFRITAPPPAPRP